MSLLIFKIENIRKEKWFIIREIKEGDQYRNKWKVSSFLWYEMFSCHLLLITVLCIFLFFTISFTIPGLVIFIENSVEVAIVDLLWID